MTHIDNRYVISIYRTGLPVMVRSAGSVMMMMVTNFMDICVTSTTSSQPMDTVKEKTIWFAWQELGSGLDIEFASRRSSNATTTFSVKMEVTKKTVRRYILRRNSFQQMPNMSAKVPSWSLGLRETRVGNFSRWELWGEYDSFFQRLLFWKYQNQVRRQPPVPSWWRRGWLQGSSGGFPRHEFVNNHHQHCLKMFWGKVLNKQKSLGNT